MNDLQNVVTLVHVRIARTGSETFSFREGAFQPVDCIPGKIDGWVHRDFHNRMTREEIAQIVKHIQLP